MRIDRLPTSMIVLGGGFIAAEMSHVFASLGTNVTIVQRGPDLLASHDHDIRSRFTQLAADRFDLRLNTTIERVVATATGIAVDTLTDDEPGHIEAETLLVATGRVPNSDRLDITAGGLTSDDHGHVVTDETYATGVPGVWAFGDLANHFQLKHMANAEARIVRHNLLHPERLRRAAFDLVPSAVFADPQVASAGPTEEALRDQRRPYIVACRDYADAGYGWALEDTTSFVKVIADPSTRRLLAAHIIGPQASTLIQPLIQAICLGNTVDDVATGVLYIHPALSEVVEQALLDLKSPDR
jgi:mycothione reductase